MSERILVVEDDRATSDAVASALRESAYEVTVVENGDRALALARGHEHDLMVLDLLLPGTPGLEICSLLRTERNDLPIVVLSGLDSEADRIAALDSGADDYLTKPFSIPELVSRVRSLLRRRELDRANDGFVRTVGGLRIDVARHTASVDGTPVLLTRSEFRLVALLASEPGKAFEREQLIRHLWESDFVGDRRAVDVHVSNLRRKLERDPRRPERLVTVRGVGYKLVAA